MKNSQLEHIQFNVPDEHLPEAETTHVVVFIMQDGVLFGGLNDQNEVLTIRLGRPKEGVMYSEYEFIRHEIMDEPLLTFSDKRVTVFVEDLRQLPVPKEASNTAWLSHLYFMLPEEEQHSYPINENLHLDYIINTGMKEIIEQYIPDALVLPFGTLMLKSQNEAIATVALAGERYWISVMQTQELKAWYNGHFENEHDVAFTLLNWMQKHPAYRNVPVHYLSCNEPEAQFDQSFLSYFSNLQTAMQEEQAQYGEWWPTVQLIQRAAQCV